MFLLAEVIYLVYDYVRRIEVNSENILRNIKKMYDEHYYKMFIISEKNNSGGEIREKSGKIVEDVSFFVLSTLAKNNGVSNIKCLKGDKGMEGSVTFHSKNGKINVGVDRHLILNDKFVLAEENKSYLDKCYLDRACSEFNKLKKKYPMIVCNVLSIENACDFQSISYFLDEESVDNINFLTDKKIKRNSTKPIYKKQFHKPLNNSMVLEYISFVDNVIKKFKKEEEKYEIFIN